MSVFQEFLIPAGVGALSGFLSGWISGWLGLKTVSKARRIREIERISQTVRNIEELAGTYWVKDGSDPDTKEIELKIVRSFKYLARDIMLLPHKKARRQLIIDSLKKFRSASTGGSFQQSGRKANTETVNKVFIASYELLRALNRLEN